MFLTSYLSNQILSPVQLLTLCLVLSTNIIAEKREPLDQSISESFTISSRISPRTSRNLRASEDIILKRQSAGGGGCADAGVVFARGTSEPGTVGTLTGPPFFKALRSAMGAGNDLAVKGVEYDASVQGFLQGGSPDGARTMAKLVSDMVNDCPDMFLVLSGYSQGAQVVHKATDSLPAGVMEKVGAVVMFGDPNNGDPIKNLDPSKAMTICHTTDKICDGKSTILPSHLTYSRDAPAAADFVMSQMGAAN